MKLNQQEHEIKVGDDGLIVLREPTNEEWNKFESDRYPVGKRNKMQDNSGPSRCSLFDKLLVRVENLEDDKGPIDGTDKTRIPARLKGQIIFATFEQADIDVKN